MQQFNKLIHCVLLVSVLQKLASFPGCSPAFATQGCEQPGNDHEGIYIYMKQKLSQVRNRQQCMRLPVLLALLLSALLTTALTWGVHCVAGWDRANVRKSILISRELRTKTGHVVQPAKHVRSTVNVHIRPHKGKWFHAANVQASSDNSATATK